MNVRIYFLALLFLSACNDHSDSAAEANAKIQRCAANGMDWSEHEGTFSIEHVVCDGKLGTRHSANDLGLFPE